MHHKKHETRHQSVSSSSSSPASFHYRSATRSSTLKLNKAAKVKRLIRSSAARNDENRLHIKRASECHQHSTPIPTPGNIALFTQTSQCSSPLYATRRRPPSTSNMTSYSALKRKTQRADVTASMSRFQVNLEHVLGFTSISNSVVSQDRSTIAYAAGSTVVLYDLYTQKQDFIISPARKAITSLSLSPDGRYLATGECGHDPKVRVWDLHGDKTTCIELGDHKFAIDCVCFSPNVDRLVSIGSVHDGNIYVWNWKEKKKLASNKCTCAVRRISFAEDGSYFVTVGNRHVKFWYLVPTSSLEVVPLRGRYAILAERKDNLFTDVVCGRGDCAGMTYAITSNGLICQFDEHRQMRGERDLQERTNCLAIGDMYLVVGCMKGAIYVFSPQTLDYVMSIPLPHYLGVDIAFVKSIDQITYSQQQQHNASFPDTVAVCLDEDKSVLTCFYNDHSFYIWDIRNERAVKKRDSHMYHSSCGWGIETYPRTSTSPSVLRQLSCVTCSSDNSIRFWTLNQNDPDSYTPGSASCANIFSRQLMKIVYLDDDHSKLCDNQANQERPEFVPKTGGRCLKINPDGLSMAIGDRNGNIRIFSMETFQQVALVEAHDSEVLSVDYSRSNDIGTTFLASSSRDRFVHIFDVTKDYQLVATLDDHSAAITAVRFTHSSITSSLQLVSCSADKSLIFRSVLKSENGKFQFVRSNNIVEKQTFYDLAIDHTRELVSTACQDRMIRVYNLQDGKRVRTRRGTTGDDSGYLIKIDIDASGRYLASSCSNKCVYIWDTITSECVASLCGHSEIVTDLKFSADGRRLFTISGDSCVFVWNTAELAIVPTTCRAPPVPLTKLVDAETTDIDESISQSMHVVEERQCKLKQQRSVWGTADPPSPSFDSKFLRSKLADLTIQQSPDKAFRSVSSQDEETTFLEEDTDRTFSITADNSNSKMNSFFAENYDHDNVTNTTLVSDGFGPSSEIKRRKSVSSRFRSVPKDTPTNDTSVTSPNSTTTDHSSAPPTQPVHRPSKYVRSPIAATSTDSKAVPTRSYMRRDARALRTRSEDRCRGPYFSSQLDSGGETTATSSSTSSSSSQLPSYAAHTSSSMNKLREGSSAALPPSSSNTSLTATSTRARFPPSTASFDPHTSTQKGVVKSRSTHNLALPAAGMPITNTHPSKASLSSSRPSKVTFTVRRPPNLPTAGIALSSTAVSTSSSSSSSNTSSPIKPKPHLPPSLKESILPVPALDTSANDLMPKWAQDCFYRTVVLGLKPLLLQEAPISPMKHSTSTSSIESSDSQDLTNELINNLNELPIRRSLPVADYAQAEPGKVKPAYEEKAESSKLIDNLTSNGSSPSDHRMPVISHLVDDLHKRLNELESFYSTVSHSSDKRDLMLKQTLERVFTDLHTRISSDHQQSSLADKVADD